MRPLILLLGTQPVTVYLTALLLLRPRPGINSLLGAVGQLVQIKTGDIQTYGEGWGNKVVLHFTNRVPGQ